MGVVRLRGGEDRLAGTEPPGHPERLEVRHRAAAAEVAEVLAPAEHARELGDRLVLHRRAGAPAVERVVVGVDPRRQRVREPRHRVRRLQHLTGVERMEVREVVVQSRRDLEQHVADRRGAGRIGVRRRQRGESLLEPRQRGGEHREGFAIEGEAGARAGATFVPQARRSLPRPAAATGRSSWKTPRMPDSPADPATLLEPHLRDGRFYCPWPVPRRSLRDFLRWQLGRPSAQSRRPRSATPIVANDGSSLRRVAPTLEVTWIGHASFVLHEGGRVLLLDPHFGPRAFLPGRRTPPGIPLSAVPESAVALLSHNHYDHLDDWTLERLPKTIEWLVPMILREHLELAGFQRVRELDWWGAAEAGGWRFTFLPAQHWSRRFGEPENLTLWGSWLIDTGTTRVFFGDDSGWFHGFAEYGRRFAPVDLALLPIGAYEPRWFMGPAHLSPEEALRAVRDLDARRFVPMHWGTFDLSDEPLDEPPRALARELARDLYADLAPRTHVMAVGETLKI